MVRRDEKKIHRSKGSYLLVVPISFVHEHDLGRDLYLSIMTPSVSFLFSPSYIFFLSRVSSLTSNIVRSSVSFTSRSSGAQT
jgi:hypothetical protein